MLGSTLVAYLHKESHQISKELTNKSMAEPLVLFLRLNVLLNMFILVNKNINNCSIHVHDIQFGKQSYPSIEYFELLLNDSFWKGLKIWNLYYMVYIEDLMCEWATRN